MGVIGYPITSVILLKIFLHTYIIFNISEYLHFILRKGSRAKWEPLLTFRLSPATGKPASSLWPHPPCNKCGKKNTMFVQFRNPSHDVYWYIYFQIHLNSWVFFLFFLHAYLCKHTDACKSIYIRKCTYQESVRQEIQSNMT